MTMPDYPHIHDTSHRSPHRRAWWTAVVVLAILAFCALVACTDQRTAEQRAMDDRAEAVAAIERIIPEAQRQSAVIAIYDRWEVLIHKRQRADAADVDDLRTLNANYTTTPAAFAEFYHQRDQADARFMDDALAIRTNLQQVVDEQEWKQLAQVRAIARSHMPRITEGSTR